MMGVKKDYRVQLSIVVHFEELVSAHCGNDDIVHIRTHKILLDEQTKLRFDPIGYGSQIDRSIAHLNKIMVSQYLLLIMKQLRLFLY